MHSGGSWRPEVPSLVGEMYTQTLNTKYQILEIIIILSYNSGSNQQRNNKRLDLILNVQRKISKHSGKLQHKQIAIILNIVIKNKYDSSWLKHERKTDDISIIILCIIRTNYNLLACVARKEYSYPFNQNGMESILVKKNSRCLSKVLD